MTDLSLVRYSSEVSIRLIVGELSLDVAQIARQTLILREARDLPPATAGQLVIKIDEREESRQVILHAGASSASKQVNFS